MTGSALTLKPGDFRRRGIACAFGAALRTIRQERRISQDSLASPCDFDRTYPSLLERGLRGPTVYMLLRLSIALDVGPERLLTDTVARLRGKGAVSGTHGC